MDAKKKLTDYKIQQEKNNDTREWDKTDVQGKLFMINNYLARVYGKIENISALQSIVKEMEDGMQSERQKIFIYEQKGNLAFQQKKYNEAIKNYKAAFDMAEKDKDYRSIAAYGQSLNQLYNLKGDVASANKYIEKSKSADNFLKVFTTNKALNADLYKRDKEALALNLKNQKQKTYIIILLLALALMALWLIIRRKKTNEKLYAQNLKHAQLQNDLQQLELKYDSQMQERKRIATELHDGLGASLTGIKAVAEVFAREHSQAGAMVNMLDQVHKEMRAISHDLIPPDFEHTPLHILIENLVNMLQHNTQRNVQCIVEDDAKEISLTLKQKKSLYRMAQELLGNAIRHSGAQNIEVMLSVANDDLLLSVDDDGKGFDKDTAKYGLGLSNCRERCKDINARFSLDAKPGNGTLVHIILPLNKYEYAS